jgi:hypothetical protein
LAEHLDEVRAEPVVDDLAGVVESEGQHERRLDASFGWLLDEQPWPSLRAADVVEDDHHVTLGDGPVHLPLEVGERP